VKTLSFLTAAVCLSAATLFAQTESAPEGPPPGPHGFMRGGPGGPGGMGPIGMGMHLGKVVAGAPYSADVNTSTTQTLSDGNTISRATTGHVARDGQGRTYFEQNISEGPWAAKGVTTITFLSDPVAGYTYILNPSTKIAMRRPFKQHEDDRRPAPPPDAMRPPRVNDRAEADLGTQLVGGVSASGKSITRTIPAGAIGNSQPIVEKSEIWTSPDLQVVVLSKRNDPRAGQSTYTLTNIQRSEPNATLVQVPSDYKVEDAPFHGRR